MTAETAALQVLLGELPVGVLVADRNGIFEFRLLTSYLDLYPRPLLGQYFLDDMHAVHRHRARLPPWFSNLLPEGPLRALIAQQAQLREGQEFSLIQRLGGDLPGAVKIQAKTAHAEDWQVASAEMQDTDAAKMWHFSLAGVQLKFSAVQQGRGLTVPLSGAGGDWIVKLPDARFADVPRNEFATAQWARACGIDVPETLLLPIADIDGLPAAAARFPGQSAFAIRRFDRPAPGHRIHIEDFAQVLGIYPEKKYDHCNYETLAKVILSTVGRAGLDEFIRRLIFDVACGNGDAHLKNWSLIYVDPLRPQLSPAYDLVSTIQYFPQDLLALNLARSKQWTDVSAASFARLARKLDIDPAGIARQVEASVQTILAAWRWGNADFSYTGVERKNMDAHLKSVPLFR